jgi:hypothetical protein
MLNPSKAQKAIVKTRLKPLITGLSLLALSDLNLQLSTAFAHKARSSVIKAG